MATALPSPPGLYAGSVKDVPATWDPAWFRRFVSNFLQGGDARNALGVNGITISGNLTAKRATIGIGASAAITVGTITTTQGGSSLQGTVTITAPTSSGVALIVDAFTGQPALQIRGGTSGTASVARVDLTDSAGSRLGYFGATNNPIEGSTNPFVIESDTGNITFIPASGGKVDASYDGGATFLELGFRGLPLNVQSANYTIVASDRGKMLTQAFNNTNPTYTLNSGVFNAGDAFGVASFFGTNTITLSPGAGVTLYLGNGTTTNGARTITSVGMAVVLCIGSNDFICGGGAALT
jgi:hypothetical protein